MSEIIGILHPGQMGISIAAAAQRAGHQVWYASEGRSPGTRARAQEHALRAADSLADLCRVCTVIVSICPPHAAGQVAEGVLAHGFKGLYLDANAIAPQRALRIGQRLEAEGIRFVDGGIIGGPAWEAGETWLYLSGKEAGRIADCFEQGPLEVSILGEQIGRASALKMCYAAYSKGTTALLAAILALADVSGVRDELYGQWDRDGILSPAQTEERVRRVTAKAWRFAGEMDEIAATFEAAGLPGGFHAAAGEIYRRMKSFQGAGQVPGLADVLSRLLNREGG
jgi:3-hydroxyisobutyrate dehydrogenase-like beta-hydroxyacid dehydrogenase